MVSKKLYIYLVLPLGAVKTEKRAVFCDDEPYKPFENYPCQVTGDTFQVIKLLEGPIIIEFLGGERMNSILQDTKKCYKTGDTYNLHRHHIYGGSRRKASEKWGCWVWLRGDWHNLAKYGVHNDSKFDIALKQECQKAFEKLHGHEKFMEVFGKNYI